MFEVLRRSLLFAAPILSFTADEVWAQAPAYAGKEGSVHLGEFPPERSWLGGQGQAFIEDMKGLLAVRETVLKGLEKSRGEGLIGNSLEAKVTLRAPESLAVLLEKYRDDLPALFIVSAVVLENKAASDLEVVIGRAPGAKCERCWNYSTFVGQSQEHPTFCARCEAVVQAIVP
jgi:isoleucyl-tRNA synthetase